MTRRKTTYRKVHKWLGLFVALYLVFQSTSGLMLLYRHDIEALASQAGLEETGDQGLVPVQTIVDALQTAYPSNAIDRIYFPTAQGEPYLAHLLMPDGVTRVIVEPNAYSGVVAGPRAMTNFLQFVFDLHHQLSLGSCGSYVVGAVGLLLVASSVIGFWLWWPGFRSVLKSLRIKLSGGGIRALFDLHRVFGSVLCLFIVLSAATGFALAYGTPLRSLIETTVGPKIAMSTGEDRLALSADQLIANARLKMPGEKIRDIRFAQPGNFLETIVFFRNTKGGAGPFHRVWVDPYTGVVRGVVDSRALDTGNAFLGWMYPIHTELGAGNAGRLLLTLGGLGILFLSITGPLLWWRKRVLRANRKPHPSTGV